MILDSLLMFSDAQAVTSAAGSTNTIDTSEIRDLGTGTPLYVVVVVTTAMTDSGSDSTLTVALEGDSTDSFTPDATRSLFIIPALSAAGATFISPLHPAGAPEALRYLRLKYTPNDGDLSAGNFSAFLTDNVHQVRLFAKNYTIS